MVAAVILAAGAARRMGRPKQLLPLGGRTMVWQVAHQACRAGLAEVVVVTGAYAPEVEASLAGLPLKAVFNKDWQLGQSASVSAGVRALGPAAAVLFLLADQPLVDAALIRKVIAAYHAGRSSIVVPRSEDRPGNPALFDLERWRKELLGLSGDEGARRIIACHPEAVAYVDVGDRSAFFDADTWEEYERLAGLWAARSPDGPGGT
ncbi:MAG TPA: nucleotidyltransferase family protein [Selenomonadales bacterium]|nr:nucleotidyltransferase family protein [Selenomonadales bacterium]